MGDQKKVGVDAGGTLIKIAIRDEKKLNFRSFHVRERSGLSSDWSVRP